MVFKFKDLIVALPQDPAALRPCGFITCLLSPCGHFSPCGHHSPCGAFTPCGHLTPCGGCSAIVSPCGGISCGPTFSLCQVPSNCAGISCGPNFSLCLLPSNCGVVSPCGANSPCGHIASQCGPISGGCGVSFLPEDPLSRAEALAVLKNELRQALTQVEEAEKAAQEGLKPQTAEQIADLEKRLTSALEELKARRQELDKKKK